MTTKASRSTRSHKNTNHKAGSRASKYETGDKCRHYKARTTLVVQRASATVASIERCSIPKFVPVATTCLSLYKEVKQFLSREVSLYPEVQMAFQSIKKLLPDACACMQGEMLSDLHARLSRPPPSPSPAFLSFCRSEVATLFKRGWDRNWEEKVQTFSPSLGSCLGSGRKDGGQLSRLSACGQQAYIDSLVKPHGSLVGELLLVNSSGKPRSLTRFDAASAYLRPLHGLIYDQLSRNSWLLRGDVTEKVLKNAGFSAGTLLTSGDYVSASDNLSIEVAELCLDVMWSASDLIPAEVWRFALAAQRPTLSYEDKDHLVQTFIPTIGQMMGSYLCFPLLCLQNYLAFRWAEETYGINGTPVLINGDDILFQADINFSRHWEECIVEAGFEVEPTKTSRSVDYGSINSGLIRVSDGMVKPVATTRMGLLATPDHPGALGDSFRKFCNVGTPKYRLHRGVSFLRWHTRTLFKWYATSRDMRFFGSLAKRAWKVFRGGELWRRNVALNLVGADELEPVPCPHNLVMAGNEFEWVDSDLVSDDDRKKISRWMAARKWELGRTFKRVKSSRLSRDRVCNIRPILKRYETFKELPFAQTEFEVDLRWPVSLVSPPSQWRVPKKKDGVRVPRVLLPEMGLAIDKGPEISEILERQDATRYGIGGYLYSLMQTMPVPCWKTTL